MLAFCPEHPKWDQNPKFTPPSETTSIPTPFICWVHPAGVTHGNVHTQRLHFRALRPCDQDSPISVWKPVYLFRAFLYTYGGWWAIEGDSTPCSFVYSKGKHTFLEKKALKNTWPFMRLIELKERSRVFKEQARIQSSESDAREEEVLAWKHDVSLKSKSKCLICKGQYSPSSADICCAVLCSCYVR